MKLPIGHPIKLPMPTTPPEPLFFQFRCFEVDLTVAARQAGEEAKGRRSPAAKQPSSLPQRSDSQTPRMVIEYWMYWVSLMEFMDISTATWKRLPVDPTGTVAAPALGQDVHAGCIPNFIRNFVPQLRMAFPHRSHRLQR